MTENTTTTDTTTAADAATVVEHLNPADLLVDVNIRHDDRLDPDFLASIKALGVLVPIVGVRTPTGAVRVRYGHRRTHAACAGGLATVPVVVVADETTTDEASIERLVTQHAENTHRAGLTRSEQVGVIDQLSLLGVSAHQIAKRTRIARPDVDAALTVARSEAARTGVDRYDLDLTQAAMLAEFDGDEDTQAALIESAQRGPGAFTHAAQRARDDRDRATALDALTRDLVAAGHTLADADTGLSLERLVTPAGERITPEDHATCPGHAVRAETRRGYVDPATGQPPVEDTTYTDDGDDDTDQGDSVEEGGASETDEDGDDWEDEEPAADLVWDEYPAAVWVCTDPETHGHRDRWATISSNGSGYGEPRRKVADMDPAEAAAARAERRDTIESNKAWKAAETVRRDWVRTLLTRKTPPAGAAAFLATTLATARFIFDGQRVPAVTADLLGTTTGGYGQPDPTLAMIEAASTKRCEVIALGLVLAAHEANLHLDHWRRVDTTTAHYLRFLDDCGYDRSNVERRATGDDPLPEPSDPAGYAGE